MPSERGEVEPTKVPVKVVGVEDEPVATASRQGPSPVRCCRASISATKGIRVHRGRDEVPFDQKDTGKITTFDRCHGQLNDAGQGVGHAAGREKDPSGFSESDGELREASAPRRPRRSLAISKVLLPTRSGSH